MELVIIAVLIITNAATLFYYKRAQTLNKRMHQNPELINEYLKAHNALERSAGCLLEVKKKNTEGMFFVGPQR